MKKIISKKSMKKKRGTAAAVLVSLSVLTPAHVEAVTATMPMLVNMVRAVEITLNTSLDFGTLAMTLERAGQATIDPFVNKLFVDGSSSLTPAGGEPRAGRVQIKGALKPITVSVENATVFLTNGTSTIQINNFNFNTLNGGSQVTVTQTDEGIPLLVPVGATLNAKQGQVSGTYVGSNRIFANFQ